MKIALASDHGGYAAKEELKKYLLVLGHEVLDEGTTSCESCDYPLFAKKAAEDVSTGKAEKGILVCTSGEGVAITANKIDGIRCGIAYNDEVARLIVEHNDCNMVAFGAKYMEIRDILNRSEIFLNATFEGGRHARRVDQIKALEK